MCEKSWSTIVVGLAGEAAETAVKDFNDAQVSGPLNVPFLTNNFRDWRI